MFRGTFTALVTPFRDGEIDIAALEQLIETPDRGRYHRSGRRRHNRRITNLSHEERESVIAADGENCAEVAARFLRAPDRIPLATPLNDTVAAEKMGVDGSVDRRARITTNRARKDSFGIFMRSRGDVAAASCSTTFRAVAGRYRRRDSRAAGARLQNIVSIKEASGSVERVSDSAAVCLKTSPF